MSLLKQPGRLGTRTKQQVHATHIRKKTVAVLENLLIFRQSCHKSFFQIVGRQWILQLWAFRKHINIFDEQRKI